MELLAAFLQHLKMTIRLISMMKKFELRKIISSLDVIFGDVRSD